LADIFRRCPLNDRNSLKAETFGGLGLWQNVAGRVVKGLAGLYNVFDFGRDPGGQTWDYENSQADHKNYRSDAGRFSAYRSMLPQVI